MSTELYRVIDVITVPRNPPLYQIRNITTNQLVKALFTNEQLQIVPPSYAKL